MAHAYLVSCVFSVHESPETEVSPLGFKSCDTFSMPRRQERHTMGHWKCKLAAHAPQSDVFLSPALSLFQYTHTADLCHVFQCALIIYLFVSFRGCSVTFWHTLNCFPCISICSVRRARRHCLSRQRVQLCLGWPRVSEWVIRSHQTITRLASQTALCMRRRTSLSPLLPPPPPLTHLHSCMHIR